MTAIKIRRGIVIDGNLLEDTLSDSFCPIIFFFLQDCFPFVFQFSHDSYDCLWLLVRLASLIRGRMLSLYSLELEKKNQGVYNIGNSGQSKYIWYSIYHVFCELQPFG